MAELLKKEQLESYAELFKVNTGPPFGYVDKAVKAGNALLAHCRQLEELLESATKVGTETVQQLRDAEMWVADVEEREAAVCPEDVPFDEYIRALEAERDSALQDFAVEINSVRAKLRGVEAERDDLRVRLTARENELRTKLYTKPLPAISEQKKNSGG